MKRMLSLWISVMMILILIPAVPSARAAAADLSEESVRAAMLAMKAQYPEGTPFGNDVFKSWKGGIYGGGFGCAGFAFMLSDAAFGSLPARKYYDYTQVRVGDILRLNNDSHSVIVLSINADSFTIAEGNFNSKVHWGRELKKSEVMNGTTTYALTRYPESAGKGDINGDSAISADDAQIVLRAYVRRISGRAAGLTQAQISAADVDSNGIADLEDAQYILRYYVLNGISHRNVPWSAIIKK